ncbi:MAG: OmpA family protein [Dinoroseobacter sp.]|nr:OmpA family protein [Dinoroseobacter sp.]MDJ0991962.1 OmpA family protein [Dinoroseobacter sp.]
MSSPKSILLLAAGAFALSACTVPADRQNTATGAAAGAAIGGLIGATNNTQSALIGAALGAGVGAIIGDKLDAQEAALRQSLGSDQILIENTGTELIVTMPQDILFDVDSAELQPALRNDLGALAGNLNDYPDTQVRVIGHTDNTGAASYNLALSKKRAASVAGVLSQSGVDTGRVLAIGAGEESPVASNLDEFGRAQNRRVEIVISPTV